MVKIMLSKIEILYSVVLYPQKFKRMQFEKYYDFTGKLTMRFAQGAVGFVPIWDAELYRSAILPDLQTAQITSTLYGSTWRTRDPFKAYTIKLLGDSTKAQLISNDTPEMAILTEVWPDNLTQF